MQTRAVGRLALERRILKTRLTRITSIRATVAAATAMVIGVAVLVPGLAGADSATLTTSTPTVYIKDGKGGLRFVAPKTVIEGEELQVVNTTNAKQVGPNTFSLVTPESIPKTKKARQ